MLRTIFYYTIDDVDYTFAVKHCKTPEKTNIYKHLIKLLDKNEVSSIGYKLGELKQNQNN